MLSTAIHESQQTLGSYDDFARLVGGIPLNDVLVPQDASRDISQIRTAERFSLAPLLETDTGWQKPEGLALPGVYGQDAPNAIALVYRGVIAAVASARLDRRGRLLLEQIQGYDNTGKGGLNAGIAWTKSLVMAWMAAARSLGVEEVGIQTSQDNSYALEVGRLRLLQSGMSRKKLRRMEAWYYFGMKRKLIRAAGIAALHPLYDGLAASLGFTRESENGNWYHSLEPAAE